MKRRRTLFTKYDLFKLTVALLFLSSAIVVFVNKTDPFFPASTTQVPNQAKATSTPVSRDETSEQAPSKTPDQAAATAKPTAEITASPPSPSAEAVTSTPEPDGPKFDISEACSSLAAPIRIDIGSIVVNSRRLNLRSSPEVSEDNWITTQWAQTYFEVIDGPICREHEGGAHIWWKVKSSDNVIGWTAEGNAVGLAYFLAPADLPPYPDIENIEWDYRVEEGLLYTSEGDPLFSLGEETWIPFVPSDIQAFLPAGTVPERYGAHNWVLLNEQGHVEYLWDTNELVWSKLQSFSRETAPEDFEKCAELAAPTRLEIGMTVENLSRVNLRSSPDISPDNWLTTLWANTSFEVIDGPVCVEYDLGAHIWWEVETTDGVSGWTAEGEHNGNSYYLVPSE